VDEKGGVVENLHFHLGGVLIEARHASPTLIGSSSNAALSDGSRDRREIDFSS